MYVINLLSKECRMIYLSFLPYWLLPCCSISSFKCFISFSRSFLWYIKKSNTFTLTLWSSKALPTQRKQTYGQPTTVLLVVVLYPCSPFLICIQIIGATNWTESYNWQTVPREQGLVQQTSWWEQRLQADVSSVTFPLFALMKG